MSNAPSSLSPRQRMINMMYLVLTALLALNVSKEVLNAFQSVNFGLANTNESTNDNNDQVYTQFEYAAERNPVKAGPWKTKAFEVKKRVDSLQFLINEIKYDLVMKVDKEVLFLGHVDEDGKAIPLKDKKVSYRQLLENDANSDSPVGFKDMKIGYKDKKGKLRVLENDKNRDKSWELMSDEVLKLNQKKLTKVQYGPKLKNFVTPLGGGFGY